jgi:hypothetical protein
MHLRATLIMAAAFVLVGSLHSDERPAPQHKEEGFKLFPANKIVWKDGPASLPKGAQIAVLVPVPVHKFRAGQDFGL